MPPAAPAGDAKTRVMPAAAPAAEVPGDPEKTRVMQRSAQPVPPPDEEKTHVMKRAAPPPAVVPLPPAPAQPPKPSPSVAPPRSHPPSQSLSGLRFRYCPSCTTPNPPDAVICQRCKAPLGGPRTPAQAAGSRSQWPLYLALAVAGILAVALILVLLLKRS
jgi:hypothetical protein